MALSTITEKNENARSLWIKQSEEEKERRGNIMMRTRPHPEMVLYLLTSTHSEWGAMGWKGMKENE
jgi:hypothetical protein